MKKIIKKAGSGLICEIVRQLGAGEIDHDMASHIVEHRLHLPEGPSVRETQARRLFDAFGDALAIDGFEQYLEVVPLIPKFPNTYVRFFGRENVCLVDRRIVRKVGLTEYCRLAGLGYGGNEDTFEAFESKQVKKEDLYWMLYQDGYRNRNRKPTDRSTTFAPFEVGMDVIEGIGVYTQNPDVIIEHCMDLPGSVRRGSRGHCAYLGVFGDEPKLDWRWDDESDPECGSASRGK